MEENKGILHFILAIIIQGIIVGIVLAIAWPVKSLIERVAGKLKEAIEPEIEIKGKVEI